MQDDVDRGPIIRVEGVDEVAVEAKADEPILTAFNRAGFSYIVGCKRGGCGICKLDIVSGAVHYDKVVADTVLPPEDRDRIALSCRAVADHDLVLRIDPTSKFKAVSPYFAKLAKALAEQTAAVAAPALAAAIEPHREVEPIGETVTQPSSAHHDPASVTTQRNLTLAGAQQAIAAALAKAEELGERVCISVADRAGNEITCVRMDGAPLISKGIAADKAYTVAAFGPDTRDWWNIIKDEEALKAGIVKTDRLVVFGGGVGIRLGEECIGAVGVSGSTSEGDHTIASAGAGALQ